MSNIQFDPARTRATVSLERHLEATPATVWNDLTDRDRLRTWFPCDVIVKGGAWRVGATISFPFPPEIIDMTLRGEVLECEEQTRLSYTWGEDVLTFELHHEKESTTLVLRNELAPSAAARNAAGWDDCLDRLAGRPVDQARGRHTSTSTDRGSRAFSVLKRVRPRDTREPTTSLGR